MTRLTLQELFILAYFLVLFNPQLGRLNSLQLVLTLTNSGVASYGRDPQVSQKATRTTTVLCYSRVTK